jgi:phage gp36-like protein
VYATPTDVRVAANPEFDPSSPQPDPTAGDAAALTDAQLSAAIAEAQSTVDDYLRARYAVPVADPAPDVLKTWTTDIALYRATLTWLRHVTLDPRDPVQLRYDSAMASLVAARDGKTLLNLPPVDGPTGAGFAGIADQGPGAGLFTDADAGFHEAGVGFGVTPWDRGGYLYGQW